MEILSIQNNIDFQDDITTIHSADENTDNGIPISERPINEFSNQLILKENSARENHTLRFTIEYKQIYKENFIIKDYMPNKRLTAVLTDNVTFRVVQSVYSKYFSNGNLKKV